jgi:hypothetical protein
MQRKLEEEMVNFSFFYTAKSRSEVVQLTEVGIIVELILGIFLQ